jgi:predicted DNA-binding transcriptional regulator YafY
MRADRLLSIMMTLQTQGRATAQELAKELEVSERTIYRDITALSTAGVPVYTERGPGGGISLVESYRTDLTGLSPAEARALFMLSIPAPLADLGVDQELKAALLKLNAALSSAGRQEEIKIRQRLHLDSVWWQQGTQPLPYLETLRRAVWDDRVIDITYSSLHGIPIEKRVHPYGLVAKTNVWYLVWDEQHIGVTRVSRIEKVNTLAETFTRPPDFDLAKFWTLWCERYERDWPRYQAQVCISPQIAALLKNSLTPELQQQIEDGLNNSPDEWLTLTITFETFEHARSRILGWGAAAKVLAPRALRDSIHDYAQQIDTLYSQSE